MSFIQEYNPLKQAFINEGLFTEIKGANKNIPWPESCGVYAVWKKNSEDPKNLIYVGMTGKFSRKNGQVIFNNASFIKRENRYTPYRFCQSEEDTVWKYFFRYGPKMSKGNEQAKIKYEDDAYANSISYSDLIIHCFEVNADHREYSPSLLEALILTKFMKENNNDLPPANNEL